MQRAVYIRGVLLITVEGASYMSALFGLSEMESMCMGLRRASGDLLVCLFKESATHAGA